jgi:hypothetical protein
MHIYVLVYILLSAHLCSDKGLIKVRGIVKIHEKPNNQANNNLYSQEEVLNKVSTIDELFKEYENGKLMGVPNDKLFNFIASLPSIECKNLDRLQKLGFQEKQIIDLTYKANFSVDDIAIHAQSLKELPIDSLKILLNKLKELNSDAVIAAIKVGFNKEILKQMISKLPAQEVEKILNSKTERGLITAIDQELFFDLMAKLENNH